MTMIHRVCSRIALYLFAVSVAVPLGLAPAPAALAAWSAAQGPGSATGAATVMPSGTAPSGSAASASVTISWSAAKFPNGTAVAGYVINRYNAITGALATVNAGCSGVVTTPTCTEQSVQPGTWVYTDTPVQLTWTGGASPDSAPIVVQVT
jgi:hypothetical protein